MYSDGRPIACQDNTRSTRNIKNLLACYRHFQAVYVCRRSAIDPLQLVDLLGQPLAFRSDSMICPRVCSSVYFGSKAISPSYLRETR